MGWSTAWREVPAFGMYFSCYEYIKEELQERVTGLPPYLASMFAGGASGCFTWAVIYPVDVVKTRIQTMSISTPVNQRRMLRLGADIASREGVGALFRGLGVTLIRAFPVNAIIFPVYESVLQLCFKYDLFDNC